MSSIDFSRSSPSYHFLNEWTASQRNKSNVKTKGHMRPEGGLERLLFAFIPLLKGTRSCVLYACPIIHVWKLRLILATCPGSKGLTGGGIKPRTLSDKAHHLLSTLVLLWPEFAQGTGEAPNLKGDLLQTAPLTRWSATSNCTEFTALRSRSLLPPCFPTLSVSSVDPWSSFSPGHGLSLPTVKVKVLVTQLCPTLSSSMDCSPPGSSVWNSQGKNTGVDCHFLLQGIFLTQGSNTHLLHCRLILYCLSHQGSPYTLALLKCLCHERGRVLHMRFMQGVLWRQIEAHSRLGHRHCITWFQIHNHLITDILFLVTQLCLTICDPEDHGPPDSCVREFPKQENWSGLPFPSFPPRDQTQVFYLTGRFFTTELQWYYWY